ncbi:triose-phosphate isomerase family protein [Cryobacterium sp. Hz9]|uniref:triose-phosphate isomerase family protein n=1 Tax=Cryobacterium sp. Hz9 TaxID=1259167 RepID=UPI001F53FEC3|nr:triose-phosphate isomerase family protein [Cryobacterium sp. Hz9]
MGTPDSLRTPAIYVGVSTKMYLGYQASLDWLAGVRDIIADRPGLPREVRVFVAPSFPLLHSARSILAGTGVIIGAQNCSESGGPVTGEVSPELLAEMGVELVEIGHAERRRLFGETDAVVARKTAAAVAAGLTPLLCIGEVVRVSPAEAAEFCHRQVLSALGAAVPHSAVTLASVMLAYEPVWAIGTTQPAEPAYVNEVVGRLRDRLQDSVRIIYGGSAQPGLLPLLHAVDGLFLGRFAHDPVNLGRVLDEAALR